MKKSPVFPGVLLALVCSAVSARAQAPLKVTPIPGGSNPAPAAVAPTIQPPSLPVPTVPAVPVVPTAPVASVVAPAGPAKYVVKSGDNPWTIAKKHGIKLDELLKANEIKDPKNLNVGDVLVLPPGVVSKGEPGAAPAAVEPAPASTAPPAIAAPAAGDNWELYTIKKGDNPWSIAKRLKVEHQAIVKLNEGTDFTKLSIGQQIKVPKKA